MQVYLRFSKGVAKSSFTAQGVAGTYTIGHKLDRKGAATWQVTYYHSAKGKDTEELELAELTTMQAAMDFVQDTELYISRLILLITQRYVETGEAVTCTISERYTDGTHGLSDIVFYPHSYEVEPHLAIYWYAYAVAQKVYISMAKNTFIDIKIA